MPLLKVPEVLLDLKDLFNRMKTMKRSIVTRKSEEKRKAEDIDIKVDFLYQYRGFVYANAIKILKDTDQAEDCVQIAFERVLRNIEKILALNEAQILQLPLQDSPLAAPLISSAKRGGAYRWSARIWKSS